MARADDYIRMLDDPEAPAPRGDHLSDQALREILVHMACSDGVLQEEELAFLLEVMPGRDTADVLSLVAEIGATPIDVDAISAQLETDEERAAALRFAARIAWADDVLERREEALLRRLAEGMHLSEAHLNNALDRILHQPVGEVSPAAVARATSESSLVSAEIDPSPLFNDLSAVVPDDATPIARVLVEGREAIGLYDTGMAAHFVEGDAFVPWNEVAYYTRVPLFGAAVRVVTHDDRTLTIADRKLSDIGALLERVYRI